MQNPSEEEMFELILIDDLLSRGDKPGNCGEARKLISNQIQRTSISREMRYQLEGRVAWQAYINGDFSLAWRMTERFRHNHLSRKCWGALKAAGSIKPDSSERRKQRLMRWLKIRLQEMENLDVGGRFRNDEAVNSFIKGAIQVTENRLRGFPADQPTIASFV